MGFPPQVPVAPAIATRAISRRKTRKDFQLLADLRAGEAGVLSANGNQEGAYYLAGLAVECALKACIAKGIKRHEFPPKNSDKFYSHDLTELLKLSDLANRLDRDGKKRPALATNWGVVKLWKVDCRYECSGLNGRDMYNAISGPNGVLPWIKKRW